MDLIEYSFLLENDFFLFSKNLLELFAFPLTLQW